MLPPQGGSLVQDISRPLDSFADTVAYVLLGLVSHVTLCYTTKLSRVSVLLLQRAGGVVREFRMIIHIVDIGRYFSGRHKRGSNRSTKAGLNQQC